MERGIKLDTGPMWESTLTRQGLQMLNANTGVDYEHSLFFLLRSRADLRDFFPRLDKLKRKNIGTARSLALASMRARSHQWQTRVFLLLGSSKRNEQLKNEHSSTAKIYARAQLCEHLINFGGPFASPIRTEVNHCLGWSSDTEPS